jgi:two-component system response regulator VanR
MKLMGANIMVVDDEQSIADLVEVYLRNEGFTVHKFYNGKDALKCVASEHLELPFLMSCFPI